MFNDILEYTPFGDSKKYNLLEEEHIKDTGQADFVIGNYQGGTAYFALHNFQLYTQAGRSELILNIDNNADYDILSLYSYGINLSVEGLMTIIILWGLAFYIISAFIDNKILNIISDLIMIGFAVMSLIIFLNFSKELIITPEFGLPIFTIIAGLLGLGGLIHSSMKFKK